MAEVIEEELAEFKRLNGDWMTVEWKANTVTTLNQRLLALAGK
jgi:hypothetical protein